jgi:adenylosuccinate lyase
MENIALWHERDISHSSVERILAPDITIATDFAVFRMSSIIKNLIVYPENMKKNLEQLRGIHHSQNILLALIKKGVSRQKAYEIIQSVVMKIWNSNEKLENVLNNNDEFKKYISSEELKDLFINQNFKHIEWIFQKTFK